MREKVTRQCPQTTTFKEKGEPKQIPNKVPLLTSLTPYRWAKPAHELEGFLHQGIQCQKQIYGHIWVNDGWVYVDGLSAEHYSALATVACFW